MTDYFPQMQQQVAGVLRDCPAVWETGRLVIGVSGGPDSLALLHLLRFALQPALAQENRPLQLFAAHLNHQFRPEADAEAAYVQRLCWEWGIACHTGTVDVPALAAAQGGSLEETARQERYRFLARTAGEVNAWAVAVAHHADDQAETVLMHFLRGAGPAGLRGMRPVSSLPGAPYLTLVRPFLAVSRPDIKAYCATNGLEPVMDRSNLDTTFFRNRLRHELLPILETYNPQIRRLLQQSAEVWAADVDLLADMRDAAWERLVVAGGPGWRRLDLAGWQALPLSLRRSTLRNAVWTLQESLRDVGFLPIEQARLVLEAGTVGAQATLPGDIQLTVEYDTWTLALPGPQTRRGVVPPQEDAPQIGEPELLPVPGRVALNHPWIIEAEWVEHITLAEIAGNSDPWQVFVRPTLLEGLQVRARRPGERFQPLGMAGQRAKIKELMIDRKMPAGLRAGWPIVATNDSPVWIVGHHMDQRARLTADGRAILLHCYRNEFSNA